MKNKKARLELIANLIRKENIGGQVELAGILKTYGYEVTQATLSRDLKALKITKVATDDGKYTYIIPNSNELQDSMLRKGAKSLTARAQIGFVSLQFSGNIAVLKTRNGYASGLAYDIDMSQSNVVLGTISGADTVFAILNENVSHDEARKFFGKFIPQGKLD